MKNKILKIFAISLILLIAFLITKNNLKSYDASSNVVNLSSSKIISNTSKFNRYEISYNSTEFLKGKLSYVDQNGNRKTEVFYLEPTGGVTNIFASYIDYYFNDSNTYAISSNVSLEYWSVSSNELPSDSIKSVTLLDNGNSKGFIDAINASNNIPESITSNADYSKLIFFSKNGTTLGLDMSRGGSIAYLSGDSSVFDDVNLQNINLVNIHDAGRYIQTSVYGNNMYNGSTIGLVVNGAYNPIQGGSEGNSVEQSYGSKVVSLGYNATKDEITIVTLPMLWTLNNNTYKNDHLLDSSSYGGNQSEMYMFNTYKFIDGEIIVNTRYIDFSNSFDVDLSYMDTSCTSASNSNNGSKYSTMQQELPAIYLIKNLSTFIFADSNSRFNSTKSIFTDQIMSDASSLSSDISQNNLYFPINELPGGYSSAVNSNILGLYNNQSGRYEGVTIIRNNYDISLLNCYQTDYSINTIAGSYSTLGIPNYNTAYKDDRYSYIGILSLIPTQKFKSYTSSYSMYLGKRDAALTYLNTKNYHFYLYPNGAEFNGVKDKYEISMPGAYLHYGSSNWNSIPVLTRKGYDLLGYYDRRIGGNIVYDSNGNAVAGIDKTNEMKKYKYWTDRNDNGVSQYPIYAYTGDLEIYANWEPKKFDLIINPNGGSYNNSNENINIGKLIYDSNNLSLLNSSASKEGFELIGYYDSLSKDNLVYDKDGNAVEGKYWTKSDDNNLIYTNDNNLTIYAIYESSVGNLTFNSNNELDENDVISISLNTEFKLERNKFVYPGYIFVGWNTKKDGSGNAYTDEEVVSFSKSTELFAQWKKMDGYDIKDNIIIIPIKTIGDNLTILDPNASIFKLFDTEDNELILSSKLQTNYKLLINNYKYDIAVLGDVMADGKITVHDLSKAYAAIAKSNFNGYTDAERYALDIDCDGEIGLYDLTDIFEAIKK